MLPDFPVVKARRKQLIERAARSKALEKHPVLVQLPSRVIPEGDDWRAKTVDGREDPGGFHHIEGAVSVKSSEMPEMSDEKWVDRLVDHAIGEMYNQQMKGFIQKLDQVTKATGNVVDAVGRDLDTAILDVLGRLPMTFDDEGRPEHPTMLVGKQVYDRLLAMEPSDEFNQKREALVERKRLEWRAEQADRKLVD